MNYRLLVTLILLLPVAGKAAWDVHRLNRYHAGFPLVSAGTPESTVRSLMGSPSKDLTRQQAAGTQWGCADSCSRILVYAHPYAPLYYEYWDVDLDASGNVIKTIHLAMP